MPEPKPLPEAAEALMANMPEEEPVQDRSDRSPMYFYNCAHGASNNPCPIHFGGFDANDEPLHKPMAENWYETYKPPPPEDPDADPGLTDSVSVKATPTK